MYQQKPAYHLPHRAMHLLWLLGLCACSATSLTDSWQAPSLHRQAMNDVLVVAVTQNMTNRILFERGFADALKAKGITATASYDVLSQTTPTREAVTAYVKKNDIKYVMASRLGGAEVTRELVPESVYTYYTYAGYWSGYGTGVTMTRESYVDTTTTYVLTTSIFDAKTEEVVWVGRSKTFEVGSISYEASELAHQVVKNIRN
ncbi:MAG TPA: hypothetical protein VL379_20570 [Pseudomonadales bacterium]|jgi:hypothetical protein|nr:hypothetical protein [Pseudomonadales bacterium]